MNNPWSSSLILCIALCVAGVAALVLAQDWEVISYETDHLPRSLDLPGTYQGGNDDVP